MALTGDDQNKFRELSAKIYRDQAVWFLNAFWGTPNFANEKEAETIWIYKHKCDQFDLQNRAEGSGLDELNAHRFLEHFHLTQTVQEMRNALRTAGAFKEMKFNTVPLVHFLVFLYKVDWKYLVNAPQGDNKEEIAQAQAMLDAVSRAFDESERRAHEAKVSLKNAETRESEAKASEVEAAAAKRELEAALAEVHAQQKAYDDKAAELKAKSETGGQVAQSKAKAELAQHLNTPTLPLNKARITQEAAVKKAEKTRLAAEEARRSAQAARAKAHEDKLAAEAAVDDARKKVDEAEAFLQFVKSKPGNAQGSIWWMERELHEKRAYLPTAKGGYSKKGNIIPTD